MSQHKIDDGDLCIGWSQSDRAPQHAIHRNFHGIIVLLLDSFNMPWALRGWSGPVVCMRLHSVFGCQNVRHQLSISYAPMSGLIRSLHPFKARKAQSFFISSSPQRLCFFQFTTSQKTSWPFYAPAIPYSPACFLV